jgi:hypothetical protein
MAFSDPLSAFIVYLGAHCRRHSGGYVGGRWKGVGVSGWSRRDRMFALGLFLAVLFAVLGPSVWSRWQTHERSLSSADARAITKQFTFATFAPHLPRCPSGVDPDTQFVGCYSTPYVPQQQLLSDIVGAFGKAGVHVSGQACSNPGAGALPGIQLCDVWVTHGDWHARATFTSNRRVPTPAQLRLAQARGIPLALYMGNEPYQPWTGVIAVSRNP